MKEHLPPSSRLYRKRRVEEALSDVLVDRNQLLERFLQYRLVGFGNLLCFSIDHMLY